MGRVVIEVAVEVTVESTHIHISPLSHTHGIRALYALDAPTEKDARVGRVALAAVVAVEVVHTHIPSLSHKRGIRATQTRGPY